MHVDDRIASMMESAPREGKTLRYIAKYVNVKGRHEISVNLERVSIGRPLGQLEGTANKIIIKTGTYGRRVLRFCGGARSRRGDHRPEHTRRDLLYRLDNRAMS